MIGIVGSGRDKFTEDGYTKAYLQVGQIINSFKPEQICSGNSPLKGIDYLVKQLTPPDRYIEYSPKVNQWESGYKQRNLKIAESRIVFCIVANEYPIDYKGIKFPICYHCSKHEGFKNHPSHIKSGGCWTAYKAIEKGNTAQWIVIQN